MEISVFEKMLQTHEQWYQQTISGVGEPDESDKLNLEDETLQNYQTDGVLLHDAAFSGTDIISSRFDNTDLSHAYIYQCHFRQTIFTNSNFKKAQLQDCELTDVTFQSCILPHISLEGCTLRHVCFIDCDLDWAYFSEGAYEHIIFRRCRLEGTVITDLTLTHPAFEENKITDNYPVQVSDVVIQDAKGSRTVGSFAALTQGI